MQRAATALQDVGDAESSQASIGFELHEQDDDIAGPARAHLGG